MEHDPKKGYLKKYSRIKKDATPVDDVTKFAYNDDDYEEVEEWIEYTPEELEKNKQLENQIDFLKNGNAQMNNIERAMDDVIVAVADIIGGGIQ